MRNFLFFLPIFLFSLSAMAQERMLEGYVFNDSDEPLIGAVVYWQASTQSAIADEDGFFSITRPDTTAVLLVQYVGYEPAEVIVTVDDEDLFITLSGVAVLEAIEVTGEQKGNYVSTITTRNIEQITSKELKKAACCNLAESFETNATVDVGHTNAVTGTSEIQMLGLRGIYSQLLVENRPTMNGLAQPFALEYIPGTWIEGIQISKGASSVANGPQSMTGQINVELVKPTTDVPVFINLFGNHLGRAEANVHLNRKWSGGWSTGLLLHGSGIGTEWDQNDDGFRDLPLKNQLNAMFRLFYDKPGMDGQLNIHAIRHRQDGGQLARLDNPWRIRQDNDRLEAFGKTGFVLPTDHFQSVGFIYNAYNHRYRGMYGERPHSGDQTGGYLNLLYNMQGHDPMHSFTTGLSANYDRIKENLFGVNFDRKDYVHGAFVQYGYGSSCDLTDKPFSLREFVGLIVGLRADYHQKYGLYLTPRINARLNLDAATVIRLSAGRGWRNPNFPPDWQGMLFSNRTLQVLDDVKPEDAWVYGLNFTKNIFVGERSISLVADFFHTRFVQQIVMDMESDHTRILLYNLDGRSYSNSGLLMAIMEVAKGLELKLAWKYNEVRTTYFDETLQLPMVPLHRALVTVDYVTPDKAWRFNLTAQGVGSMRMPSHQGIPADVLEGSPEVTPEYVLFNGQVSWTRGRLELYLGGENLGNYTQEKPILEAANPQSPHFDANRVFAPIFGTRIYGGLRFQLGE
ncbi:MAG: TonB-dependent receptor [Saprospiraceae bacterium]|nr:TonB-dependent receptor [Saprospiraceae bacterium]